MNSKASDVSEGVAGCPFCGGTSADEHLVNGRWSVGCDDENCIGFILNATFATKREARQAWNRRATLSPPLPSLEVERGAIADIEAERRRQVEVEGWTPEHDDSHDGGQMAKAAACYAAGSAGLGISVAFNADTYPPSGGVRRIWPWAREWWKPKDRRRNLIRAAALLVAEIERIDRAALSALPLDGGLSSD